MATYSQLSPWANTPQNNFNLELLVIRPVPAELDDFEYVVESQYRHRPDLLSFDIYGTTELWWVFAQRNREVLQDPVFDLVEGIKIRLPKKSNIENYLGD